MAQSKLRGQGSVRKRSDGTFEWRGTIAGKTRSVYATKRGELAGKIDRLKLQLAGPEPGKATLDQLFALWLASGTRAEETSARYRQRWDRHVQPRIGAKTPSSVTLGDLSELFRSVQGEALRGKVHQLIRSVSKYTGAHGYGRRWADGCQAAPRVKRREDHYSEDEARKIIEGAKVDPITHAMVRLLFATGLRRGEVLGLRWRDLDFEKQMLTVREAVKADGKIGPPKTAQSRRTISVDAVTLATLRAIKPEKATDGDRVFALDDNKYSDRWTQALRASGVRALPAHCARHSHATHLLARGARIDAVSRRLGHASIVITLQVYGHVTPRDDQGLADVIASALA